MHTGHAKLLRQHANRSWYGPQQLSCLLLVWAHLRTDASRQDEAGHQHDPTQAGQEHRVYQHKQLVAQPQRPVQACQTSPLTPGLNVAHLLAVKYREVCRECDTSNKYKLCEAGSHAHKREPKEDCTQLDFAQKCVVQNNACAASTAST